MEIVITIVVVLMLVGLFVGYGFLVIFFPEWVGIAGKKAKEIEAKHLEENNSGPEKIEDL